MRGGLVSRIEVVEIGDYVIGSRTVWSFDWVVREILQGLLLEGYVSVVLLLFV